MINRVRCVLPSIEGFLVVLVGFLLVTLRFLTGLGEGRVTGWVRGW